MGVADPPVGAGAPGQERRLDGQDGDDLQRLGRPPDRDRIMVRGAVRLRTAAIGLPDGRHDRRGNQLRHTAVRRAYLRLPTWVEAVPTISADFPESLIGASRVSCTPG